MVEYTAMSTTVSDELLRKFGPVDDPEIEARRQKILRFLLETSPSVRQELIQKGIKKGIKKGIEKGIEKGLLEARSTLRGVLEQRGLLLTQELDERLERCSDFTTLRRWMMQALTAATAAEALR
jgi:flagellar biosynthesis/type III secretory pathway protein FliH